MNRKNYLYKLSVLCLLFILTLGVCLTFAFEGLTFSYADSAAAIEAGSYADLYGGGILKINTDYKDKIKSYIFTNNLTDFGNHNIDSSDATMSVGRVYNASAKYQYELTAYLYANGDLFDCIVYAPVEIIYAPKDSTGMFAIYYNKETESEEVDKYWSQTNVEKIEFKSCFSTSKTTDMNAMFGCMPKLTELDLSSFDTSNVTDFFGMFVGCNNLKTLNISSFDFSKVTTQDCMGMLGINKQYMQLILGENYQDFYALEERADRVNLLANILVNTNLAYNMAEGRYYADMLLDTNIENIITPKIIAEDLIIGLSGGTDGDALYYSSTAQVGDIGTWKLEGGDNLILTNKAPEEPTEDPEVPGKQVANSTTVIIICSSIAGVAAVATPITVVTIKKRKHLKRK